ncbi:MAG: glucose-6-phosphate isomerase [Gemmatimonadales bacterium]|nr:MAG: glucose-6-phosphate isomerase [Gemmatimonadales bacterium]
MTPTHDDPSPEGAPPSRVSLAYANLLGPAMDSGGGVDPLRLAPGGDLDARFAEALGVFHEREAAGELGFVALPGDAEARDTVQELADSFGQWFEDLVVVGIGGSTLGGRALADALLGSHWNDRTPDEREHYPRIHFLENPDPDTVTALLARVDPRTTLFNVISKSGSTAETMALFLVIEEAVEAAVGPEKARGHFLFTTDPEDGVLRRLARERGIPALSVPPAVGGRFSVLSPVGLLPAAVGGVDLAELLGGAGDMLGRCRSPRLAENPAGLLAVLLHAADRELGAPIHVMMPYADRLRSLALWFQQLWAESLGKARRTDGTSAGTGPTPLAALGAVDQHSLLQLFMEGPADKVVIFLRVVEAGVSVTIPRRHPAEPALAYLGGHTLESLLEAERRATAEALRVAGRLSATLELSRLDARTLGGVFMLFQVATVLAGALYGVNPLDQPGVEAGKGFTYGLLGREGSTAPTLRDEDEGGFRA